MFGTDIKRIFETKYDKTYSAFINTTKQNDYLAEALTLSILDGYRSLQKEETFADMSNLIRAGKTCYVNNNQIYIWSLDISNVTFVGLTVTVTTRLPHNLAVGDSVLFQNIAGFVAPTLNGTYHTVVSITSNFSFTFAIAAIAGAYTTNTGQLISHRLTGVDKMLSDFNYLLSVKQKYLKNLNLKVKSISNTQPIKVVVDKRNDLRTGDYINIAGVVGNTNANGNFYIKKAGIYGFELYFDKALTLPVSGNGTYQGAAVVSRIFYKVGTPTFSSTKIDSFEQPSVGIPRFERADGLLKFHPLDTTCSEINIDYITLPPVSIDVTNSVIDLEDTYAPEFLYYVIDKAVNLFSQAVKDVELYNTSAIELKNA